jgi:hypothetical protein
MTDRPDSACVTHRPPTNGRAWAQADPGYRTCSRCHQRIHEWLSPITVDGDGRPDSIPGLYAMLSPLPGVGGGGQRRAPGFASRSPANDHIIAIRDPRTTRLAPGDPHSVPGVLAAWTALLADERSYAPPAGTVPAMAQFLDRNLDYITRQDWVEDLAAELRELHSQLRAIGQQRRRIGICPNTIDSGDTTKQCGTTLYAPLYGDTIKCWAPDCGREWPRAEWLRLGRLLEAG